MNFCKYYDGIYILFKTGMRISEFVGLTIKDLDFEKVIGEENLSKINAWLKEKIHTFGSTKTPDELMKISTGKSFDASYYVEYLKNKFTKLYNLK